MQESPRSSTQRRQEAHHIAVDSAVSLYTEDPNPCIDLHARNCHLWSGPRVHCQAKFIAQRCLQQCRVSFSPLRQIMVLLPVQQATRKISSGPTLPCYFGTGANIFGGQAGVNTLARAFVWVTHLLCCVVKSLCLHARFTNAFLSYKIVSKPHVDSHNRQHVPNYSIPLSR